MPSFRRVVPALGAALLLPLVATAAPASADTGALTIRFDNGIDADALGGALAGQVNFDVVTTGGGRLTRTDGWNGTQSAIRTPAFDGSADGPRGILEISNKDEDVLSPGNGEFTFGADLAIDRVSSEAGSADNGDNVVQRGLFGGDQYKIQADHDVASCRVAGSEGDVTVFSSERLTPGDWYKVRCHRDGNTVTLIVSTYVDGGATTVVSSDSDSGPIGSVDMAAGIPLTVGGKLNNNASLTVRESDQFNGSIARVVVRFGS